MSTLFKQKQLKHLVISKSVKIETFRFYLFLIYFMHNYNISQTFIYHPQNSLPLTPKQSYIIPKQFAFNSQTIIYHPKIVCLNSGGLNILPFHTYVKDFKLEINSPIFNAK